MKNKFILFFFSAFIASCGVGSETEKAATAYLNALKDKDYTLAKTLATPETAANIDMMKTGEGFGITDVKGVKCTINGEEANCIFCCSDKFSNIKMKKIGDKWLAHQPKETPGLDGNMKDTLNNVLDSSMDSLQSGLKELEKGLDTAMKELDKSLKELDKTTPSKK